MGITVNVNGIGSVTTVPDQAHEDVIERYGNDMTALANILLKDAANLTQQDATDFSNAIKNLKDLAKNGMPVLLSSMRAYMNTQMAQSLDVLFRALDAADYTYTSDFTSLQRAHDLLQQQINSSSGTTTGLNGVFKQAFLALANNQSIQAMIQLDYVKTGNDQILNAMSSLKEAITANQSSLNILADLQNIKNQVSPENAGQISSFFTTPLAQPGTTLNFSANAVTIGQVGPTILGLVTGGTIPLGSTVDLAGVSQLQNLLSHATIDSGDFIKAARSAYEDAINHGTVSGQTILNFHKSGVNLTFIDPQDSKQYTISVDFTRVVTATDFNGFKDPIGAVASGNLSTLLTQAQDSVNELLAQVAKLEQLNPSLVPGTPEFNSSAAGSLLQVVHDITGDDPSNVVSINSLMNWITDSYNQLGNSQNASLAGQFQVNLTQAITAGENLNDTQKSALQQQLFVFQEFYQSASTMLQNLNALIRKMAQNIAG